MIKHKIILFCVFALSANYLNAQNSYAIEHKKDCDFAKTFFAEHKNEFENAAKTCGLSAEFLFAIVAPEISQYGFLSNKVETYSLKVMYVQGGSAYSDFSIGVFQMKPSFIERMEASIKADTLKNFTPYLLDDKTPRQARVERVDRLNNLEWQMKYLVLFCTLVNKKFANVEFASEEAKLQFYASAYNAGYHRTEADIKRTGQKAQFPHFSNHKFRYCDVALWFYNEVQK